MKVIVYGSEKMEFISENKISNSLITVLKIKKIKNGFVCLKAILPDLRGFPIS